MSLADELLQIEELHNRGTLSDVEFQQAKAALLPQESKLDDSVEQTISEQIAELQQQARIVQIDRAWEMDRQRFLVHTKYGHQVPTRGSAIGTIVACSMFVVFGLVISFAPLNSRQQDWNSTGLILALPGIIGIVLGLHSLQKAKIYEAAYGFYHARRTKILNTNPISDSTRNGQIVPNIFVEPAKENLLTQFEQIQKHELSLDRNGLDEHERKVFN